MLRTRDSSTKTEHVRKGSKIIMLIRDYKAIKHVPKRTRKPYQKPVQTLERKLKRKKLGHIFMIRHRNRGKKLLQPTGVAKSNL